MTESMGRPPRPLSPRPVSGSAIFDRVDPAKNLDLLIRELLHPVRQPAGGIPKEVSDGKR